MLYVCHIYNAYILYSTLKDCDKILLAYNTFLSLRAKCSATPYIRLRVYGVALHLTRIC